VAVPLAQQVVRRVRVEQLRNPDPASPVDKVVRAATPRRAVRHRQAMPVALATTAGRHARRGMKVAGQAARPAVLLEVPRRVPAAQAAGR
jgi:hypothetical protein